MSSFGEGSLNVDAGTSLACGISCTIEASLTDGMPFPFSRDKSVVEMSSRMVLSSLLGYWLDVVGCSSAGEEFFMLAGALTAIGVLSVCPQLPQKRAVPGISVPQTGQFGIVIPPCREDIA